MKVSTCIHLDLDLFQKLKAASASEGRSMSRIIHEALSARLEPKTTHKAKRPKFLPKGVPTYEEFLAVNR